MRRLSWAQMTSPLSRRDDRDTSGVASTLATPQAERPGTREDSLSDQRGPGGGSTTTARDGPAATMAHSASPTK